MGIHILVRPHLYIETDPWLPIEYHIHIGHVSPQLKWVCELDIYKTENFHNGEINEESFSKPIPCLVKKGY